MARLPELTFSSFFAFAFFLRVCASGFWFWNLGGDGLI